MQIVLENASVRAELIGATPQAPEGMILVTIEDLASRVTVPLQMPRLAALQLGQALIGAARVGTGASPDGKAEVIPVREPGNATQGDPAGGVPSG